MLFRWSHDIDEETGWQFQSYYMTDRRHLSAWAENRDMWDVDVQYRFNPAQYHQFIVGANYRHNQDHERGGFSFMLLPNDFLTQWASVFAQDEMTLIEDFMSFTLGCRLEYNTFGKFQPEPTARLLITAFRAAIAVAGGLARRAQSDALRHGHSPAHERTGARIVLPVRR